MARPDFELRSRIIPMAFVNDFRNGLSPAECEIAIRNVYEDKGVLFEPPHVISDVDAFDITDGAFHVRQLTRGRSERPIVLAAVVDPGVGTERRAVVVTTVSEHTYVGPDNGVFGPALLEEEVNGAYAVKSDVFESASVTFHGRDIFAPLAARVSSGEKPADLLDVLEPIDPEGLTIVRFTPGTVVHVDGYGGKRGTSDYGGNVKLEQRGIPTNEWGEQATSAKLTLPRRSHGIPRFHVNVPVRRTFGEAAPGELLLYEGSSGQAVELAINGGEGKRSAAAKLNLYVGDQVKIDWRIPGQRKPQDREIIERVYE